LHLYKDTGFLKKDITNERFLGSCTRYSLDLLFRKDSVCCVFILVTQRLAKDLSQK